MYSHAHTGFVLRIFQQLLPFFVLFTKRSPTFEFWILNFEFFWFDLGLFSPTAPLRTTLYRPYILRRPQNIAKSHLNFALYVLPVKSKV